MIEVLINGKKKEIEIHGKIRGKELFKKLGLNGEEYLLIVNGKLSPLETPIEDGSKVEILPVISGG